MSQFESGKSGNPRGRPKGSGGKRSKLRSLQRLLEDLTPTAILKAQEILTDPEAKFETQLSAAKYVIDKLIDVHTVINDEEAKLNPNGEDSDDSDTDSRKDSGVKLSLSLCK